MGTKVITLLSDFGDQDGYVGMMKGTIAQIAPACPVIDLTHQIPPQNIPQARFVLMSAFPYFPVGTIHVAVVDPGVGSDRRGIAIAIGESATAPIGVLVGPDNGIFSGILEQHPAIAAVELTQSRYWRTPAVSATFHGRDIFAPVAAHLANGVPLEQLGTAIAPEALVRLPLPPLVQSANSLIGSIQTVDHFGNLITTIPATMLTNQRWIVELGNQTVPPVITYSDRAAGSPVALIGSHGWLEIAIVNGNAQTYFNLHPGDRVTVLLKNTLTGQKVSDVQM